MGVVRHGLAGNFLVLLLPSATVSLCMPAFFVGNHNLDSKGPFQACAADEECKVKGIPSGKGLP